MKIRNFVFRFEARMPRFRLQTSDYLPPFLSQTRRAVIRGFAIIPGFCPVNIISRIAACVCPVSGSSLMKRGTKVTRTRSHRCFSTWGRQRRRVSKNGAFSMASGKCPGSARILSDLISPCWHMSKTQRCEAIESRGKKPPKTFINLEKEKMSTEKV